MTDAPGSPQDPQPSQPYGQPPAYPPPPGYGQQPYPYPPQQPGAPYPYYYLARRTNGMAIASMVLGILWIYWIGSILALVFGYLARKQIRERGEDGNGMAIAGIVLGWIGVALLLVTIAFVVWVGLSPETFDEAGTGA